jgi:hypothetical protein
MKSCGGIVFGPVSKTESLTTVLCIDDDDDVAFAELSPCVMSDCALAVPANKTAENAAARAIEAAMLKVIILLRMPSPYF